MKILVRLEKLCKYEVGGNHLTSALTLLYL